MKTHSFPLAATLLLAICLTLLPGCTGSRVHAKNNPTRHLVAKAGQLSKNNTWYWIGLHGAVHPGIYVRRNEPTNSLFDNKHRIHQGAPATTTEAVFIAKPTGKITTLDPEAAVRVDTGTLVVFTRQKIFVLDYDEKRFGCYER